MNKVAEYLKSLQGAVIIGSLLIALSILLHGGIIRIKGVTTARTLPTTTTPTTTVPETGTNKDKLIALGAGLGLDEGQFRSCIEEERYKAEIQKDASAANAAGITGTPGFVIGKSSTDGTIRGIKIAGAYPAGVFRTVFTQLTAGTALEQIPQKVVDENFASSAQAEKDEIKTGLTVVSSTLDDDPLYGDKSAPVTMLEFSDYECPFCQRHYQETHGVLKTEFFDTGKVKLVFRDLPLSFHEPNATIDANAANCARELGGDEAYFKIHDEIYAKTQSNGKGL